MTPATVGVPLNAPVAPEIVSPLGRGGEIVYVSVPAPPLPMTGRMPPGNAAANGWFTVLATAGTGTLTVSGTLTANPKSRKAEAPTLSVTVTR